MPRFPLLVVYALLSLITREVTGATYYVDAVNGNDSNVGTSQTLAWKSFTKLNNLSGGDTGYLFSGNYVGSIIINGVVSSAESPLTIKAFTGETPILRGSSNPYSPTIKLDSCKGVVISGLVFYRNASKTIDSYKSTYVTVENCSFIGDANPTAQNPALAVLGDAGSNVVVHHNKVINNTFAGWTYTPAVSVYQTTNSLIEGNSCLQQQDDFCFYLYNVSTTSIRNNDITDSYGGISFQSEIRFVHNGTVIEENRIERMQEHALQYRAQYGIIRNNYFSNTQKEAVYFYTDSFMATTGTKMYGNTIINASTASTQAGVNMDAFNLSEDQYMGSYKIKNNIIRAYAGTDSPPIKIDYDPLNNVTVNSDFETANWEIGGNCLEHDELLIQRLSYTISAAQSDSDFQNWIYDNILYSNMSECELTQVPLTFIQASSNSDVISVEDSGYFSDGNNITAPDTLVINDCTTVVEIDSILSPTSIKLKSAVTVSLSDSVTLSFSNCPSNEEPSDPKDNISLLPIIIGAGGFLLLLIAIIAVVVVKRRKHGGSEFKNDGNREERASVPMQNVASTPSQLPTAASQSSPNSTTLAPHQIKVLEPLGEGRFGAVYKGMFNKTTPVALKKLKSEAKGMEFSREVALLSKLRHPNIIMFHGIWISSQSEEFMVFEFVNRGNLLDLLQQENQSLSSEILLNMCLQVACGMSYLEQMKIVHRDLAARNVLVKEEGGSFFLKISDFGLSRQTSDSMYQGNDNELPVRWTAPEALIYNTHSHKSDVWSFGILMWEMFEFGKTPYPQFTNAVTRQKVVEGYRLNSPKGCPQSVCDLMKQCWQEKPNQRPSFAEIESVLSQLVEDDTVSVVKNPQFQGSGNTYMNVKADTYNNK